MTAHLFVDESKEGTYLLVVASVVPEELAALCKEMRGHLRPGQRSVHFSKEANGSKTAFLRAIEASSITAVVYRAPIRRDEMAAREACLRAVARAARHSGARMIVIDRDDSVIVHDRRWLFQELGGDESSAEVRYEHRHRHEDPLLWVPDAVAWCWHRGGIWPGRLQGTVSDVIDVDPR